MYLVQTHNYFYICQGENKLTNIFFYNNINLITLTEWSIYIAFSFMEIIQCQPKETEEMVEDWQKLLIEKKHLRWWRLIF